MVLDPLYNSAGSEFFDDQQIVAQDLNNIEYTKIKTIRDTIAACIYQPGVAIDSLTDTALQVVYVDNAHFTVNPGTAIDKFGRIIYVPSNTAASGSIATDPHYHPTFPDRENIAHGQLPNVVTIYYVNIYYATQQDIQESGSFGNYYTREYDSYRIAVETALPDANSGGISLANFQVNSLGEIINSIIFDSRPLLLLALYSTGISPREVFKQLGNYWSTEGTFPCWHRFDMKAAFSYRSRGENSMNIYFDVIGPPYSDTGGYFSVAIYPAGYEYENQAVMNGFPTSGSVAYNSCAFSSGSASYSFSVDTSSLSQDSLYIVAIFLGAYLIPGNTAYVRNTIIDVS
jgi:hypothetical protein